MSVGGNGYQEVISSFKPKSNRDLQKPNGLRSSVDQLVNRCKIFEDRYCTLGNKKQKYYVDSELLKQRIRDETTVELAETLHQLSDFKPKVVKAFHSEHLSA